MDSNRPRNHAREQGLYEAVSGSDVDSESYDAEQMLLSAEKITFDELRRRQPAPKYSGYAITVFNLILFTTSVILFIALPYRRPGELNYALKQVSAWSPVLDSAEIPIVDQQVSGDFFPALDGSDLLGRLEPSSETDQRWWDEFEWQGTHLLTADELRRMGKDPAKSVKLPPEYGLGDEAFLGSVDVFHQIHCLNELRRLAFQDYYFDGERYHDDAYGTNLTHERIHTENFWMHQRHCVDMLLQALMCHADTEMVTYTWMELEDKAIPDMSVNRKCRDFSALMKWREDNALPKRLIWKLEKPNDQVMASDAHLDWISQGDVHHPFW